MVLHHGVQVIAFDREPRHLPLHLLQRAGDLTARQRQVAPGIAHAEALLEQQPDEQTGFPGRRGEDQTLHAGAVHHRAVDRQRRCRPPLRARHALDPRLAGQAVDCLTLGLRYPVPHQQDPSQHLRRDGLQASDLFQHRRRGLAHGQFGVKQQQRHRLAQHRMRGQAEFVRQVGPQLRRHQRAGLRQRLDHQERVFGRAPDGIDHLAQLAGDILR